ncbi:MAG: beta-galactosidase [Acidobacteriaceae bacterium]|nr:beta-galactosidase [Acidobacteriaceae bacterium]
MPNSAESFVLNSFEGPTSKFFRIAAALAALPLWAAPQPDWFPKKDMLTIGVYYYPEAWPESQWSRDMTNIRKLGMEFVHMGEFAWYFMEPGEGKFNFD